MCAMLDRFVVEELMIHRICAEVSVSLMNKWVASVGFHGKGALGINRQSGTAGSVYYNLHNISMYHRYLPNKMLSLTKFH